MDRWHLESVRFNLLEWRFARHLHKGYGTPNGSLMMIWIGPFRVDFADGWALDNL